MLCYFKFSSPNRFAASDLARSMAFLEKSSACARRFKKCALSRYSFVCFPRPDFPYLLLWTRMQRGIGRGREGVRERALLGIMMFHKIRFPDSDTCDTLLCFPDADTGARASCKKEKLHFVISLPSCEQFLCLQDVASQPPARTVLSLSKSTAVDACCSCIAEDRWFECAFGHFFCLLFPSHFLIPHVARQLAHFYKEA